MVEQYFVGAYAASPAHQQWQPALEREYLQAVTALPRVAGLELPWIDGLHPHDDQWLLSNFPSGADVLLTDIPGTVQRLAQQPTFGLASPDTENRAEALCIVARMRDDAHRLNDHMGRATVRTVELHSAPRASSGHPNALADSLEQIAAWDWDGAELVIEHCDTEVAGQKPEKGYLSLSAEVEAIKRSGTNVGISLNWGRSAIELRNPDRVTEHITYAAASGLLQGLMVSGASDRKSILGPAWTDAHHPFQASTLHPHGEPTSLLTEERLTKAFTAAGPLGWAGVKVGFVGGPGGLSSRVTMIADALDALDRCQTRT